MKVKPIFLFGHRKQHGKDTCCDLMQEILDKKGIRSYRTAFSKKLKEMLSELHGFNIGDFEKEEFKSSSPACLNGLTVREELVRYSSVKKQQDLLYFCRNTYKEIFENTDSDVHIISDFRFPHEYDFFMTIFDEYRKSTKNNQQYKLIKICVNRPSAEYNNDGADNMLPDHPDYWDDVITNHNTDRWLEHLELCIDRLTKRYII